MDKLFSRLQNSRLNLKNEKNLNFKKKIINIYIYYKLISEF